MLGESTCGCWEIRAPRNALGAKSADHGFAEGGLRGFAFFRFTHIVGGELEIQILVLGQRKQAGSLCIRGALLQNGTRKVV